ncbi:MAG: murein transglycosylase A [Legionellaceae bacterium]|nr:murein transglycosylase A [Legionellaceae bacterium]
MKINIRYIYIFVAVMMVLCWLLGRHTAVVTPKPVVPPGVPKKPTAPILFSPNLPTPSHGIHLKSASYFQLRGWGDSRLQKSLLAFQRSCRTFLKDDPNHLVGSEYIPLKAKDWYPACHEAAKVDASSENDIHQFFQTWFTPVEFENGKPIQGLFTGYYIPLLEGSLKKSPEYSVPIYSVPSNLITANLQQFSKTLPHRKIVGHISAKKMIPFYTRAEIDKGAIAKSASVLAWVKHPLDRLVLETEGSGIVKLIEGEQRAIGYAANNGAHYRAIASILIAKGLMTKDTASTENIRKYFDENPEKLGSIINQNQSFVFFRQLPENKVVGSQGVELSPGYSLAIDRKWIPMGVPLWLTTEIRDVKSSEIQPFNRLMIAQDTGGSIRGTVRGDIYWGPGKEATVLANTVRNMGRYWLLLPRKLSV